MDLPSLYVSHPSGRRINPELIERLVRLDAAAQVERARHESRSGYVLRSEGGPHERVFPVRQNASAFARIIGLQHLVDMAAKRSGPRHMEWASAWEQIQRKLLEGPAGSVQSEVESIMKAMAPVMRRDTTIIPLIRPRFTSHLSEEMDPHWNHPSIPEFTMARIKDARDRGLYDIVETGDVLAHPGKYQKKPTPYNKIEKGLLAIASGKSDHPVNSSETQRGTWGTDTVESAKSFLSNPETRRHPLLRSTLDELLDDRTLPIMEPGHVGYKRVMPKIIGMTSSGKKLQYQEPIYTMTEMDRGKAATMPDAKREIYDN